MEYSIGMPYRWELKIKFSDKFADSDVYLKIDKNSKQHIEITELHDTDELLYLIKTILEERDIDLDKEIKNMFGWRLCRR